MFAEIQDVLTSVAPHLLEQGGTILAVLTAVFGKQEFDRRRFKNGNGKERRGQVTEASVPLLTDIKEIAARLEMGQATTVTKLAEIDTDIGTLRVEVARLHTN